MNRQDINPPFNCDSTCYGMIMLMNDKMRPPGMLISSIQLFPLGDGHCKRARDLRAAHSLKMGSKVS